MSKNTILTTPAEFDKSDFLSLLSLSAGAAIERQNKFGELIGGAGWNVDLKNRRIIFGEKEFDCGIIGSESFTENTWLWGWAHTESGLPEISAAPSRRAKRALSDCEEFSVGKFGLDELHSGHNLSMTVVGASEKNVCYYRCPYEGGAVFVQIEGLPEEIFAPVALEALVRRYVEIIGAFYCDHRLLAAGFLHQNGCEFTAGADFILCESGGGTLRFDFEEVGGLFVTANISLN